MLQRLAALAVIAFARLVTGARAEWRGALPEAGQRIYFANHTSHGDFVLVWTVLPSWLRRMTRPVAGADYWTGGELRRFFGSSVFNAVLIDRERMDQQQNPIDIMASALDAGSSLILFPEGTRNTTDAVLLPFKSGLYHLAKARSVDCIPVWIENISRVMPKGEFLPIPLLCTVIFGAPLRPQETEGKDSFLARARDALLALRPAREDQ